MASRPAADKAGKAARASRKRPVAEKIPSVPGKPGVYMFVGPAEKVLYVGKAKNLRSRLSSYFRKPGRLDARKSSMLADVRDLKFIVTENELEALALEANLIKQYRPRFNVVLRDDKNYPYLRLTVNEEWPRLDVVRKVRRDGSMYFGPYVPSSSMKEALAFIRRNFALRPCRYRLDRPIRPCIQHQMGRCPAPCAGLVDRADYMREVQEVALFLKGRRKELLEELGAKMQKYSEELRYEDAARIRDRIQALRRAWESQRVISPELGDMDVVGCHAEGRDSAFQVFFVRNGVMIGSREFYLKDMGGVPPRELMHGFMEMFYAKDILPPPRIIAGARPGGLAPLRAWLGQKRGGPVKIEVPKEGKEFELLRMAEENARIHHEARRGAGGDAVALQMKQRLSLKVAPRSIGAFDVSSIQGAEPVGAFVWWSDGEFRTSRYRHMRIRTVKAADDYAMMRETIRRTLESLQEWPDLIVVDGGRGHLQSAGEALREFEGPPELIAVAKRPDRAFTTRAEEPLALDDRSASSLLLRRIRDEVHRFAISYHKKLRGRKLVGSPLQSIRGVGKKRRLALLRHFKSVDAIREADVGEIASVPGMSRKSAEAVKAALGRS